MGWFTVGRRARATALAASLILLVVSSAAPLAAQATDLATTHQLKVTERDQAGHPISGATVLLSAMPPDPSPGTVVPIDRRAVTNGAGEATWNIQLSPDELGFAAKNGDWLNYTAVGLDQTNHPIAVTGFSIYLGNDTEMKRQAAASPSSALVVNSTQADAHRSNVNGSAAPAYTWCDNWRWVLASTTRAWTIIGQLHTSADTVNTYFHEGLSADSSIDLAAGVNGGSWSISGSVHLGTYTGPTVGSYFYRYIETEFTYGHYRLYADCLEGSDLYQGQDTVQALSWWGGGRNSSYTISYWDNRSHSLYYSTDYGPGYVFGRDSYALAYISGAVSAFGASLGARSGASVYVQYEYHFGSAQHHYLYGLHQNPAYADAIYASSY